MKGKTKIITKLFLLVLKYKKAISSLLMFILYIPGNVHNITHFTSMCHAHCKYIGSISYIQVPIEPYKEKS